MNDKVVYSRMVVLVTNKGIELRSFLFLKLEKRYNFVNSSKTILDI